MTISKQHPIVTLLRTPLLLAGFFLSITCTLLAQKSTPLADSESAERARDHIRRFFTIATQQTGVPEDSIPGYAMESFAEFLGKQVGKPFWTPGMKFTIGSVQSIRPGDTLITVNAVTYPDSLRWIGTLEIDWVFFLKPHEQGGWRISELRRLVNIQNTLSLVRHMDTTTTFPDIVKDIIIREKSAMLLSNRELRQHFANHRAAFDTLRSFFHYSDSLHMIQRNNRYISQINNHTIQWGEAAEDVPREAIDEIIKNASRQQRNDMNARLRNFEKMRAEGQRAVERIALENGFDINRLDSLVQLMHKLRIAFANTRLPWPRSLLLTVGGIMDDAIGYLYVSEGYAPIVTPEEYFYLEDLGGGWWIFRST